VDAGTGPSEATLHELWVPGLPVPPDPFPEPVLPPGPPPPTPPPPVPPLAVPPLEELLECELDPELDELLLDDELLVELLLELLELLHCEAHCEVQAVVQTQLSKAVSSLTAFVPAVFSQPVTHAWVVHDWRQLFRPKQAWSAVHACAWALHAPLSELAAHCWQVAAALPTCVPEGVSAR
jgi:hypothetical protein